MRRRGGGGITIRHGLVSLEKQTRQVDKAGLVFRRRQGWVSLVRDNWTSLSRNSMVLSPDCAHRPALCYSCPPSSVWLAKYISHSRRQMNKHEFNGAVTRSRFSVQSSLRQSSPREKLLDGEKQFLPWSPVSCHRKNFNQIEGSKAL